MFSDPMTILGVTLTWLNAREERAKFVFGKMAVFVATWEYFNLFLATMTAFVEGWDFLETLGEGAYGE